MLIKRICILCSTLLIFCFFFGSCTSKEPGRYYSENKYSIKFPEGWEKQKETYGIEIGMSSPEELPSKGPVSNILIQVQSIPSTVNLDDILIKITPKLQSSGFTEQERNKIIIDGIEAYKIKGVADVTGFKGISLNYYLINNSRYYQIICVTSEEKFSEYAHIIEGSINSFRFE